ncbi:MAG TPA: hypothetical protein VMC08_08825 [Bacteroidales bacterium]|nr:hypothetical protein [Bacteroidales bacterium]
MNFTRLLLPAFLIPLFLLLPPSSRAQKGNPDQTGKFSAQKNKKGSDEEKEKITRWEFGLNFGAYFANPYTASYYNGSEGNVNRISFVMTNKYWYQEIAQLLQSTDTVVVKEYPGNMHYTPAITGGLYFRFNFSRHWGIFLQMDYVQLKTDGQFTVQVDSAYYLTNPDIRLFGIHGREQRVNFDLGAHCRFPVYRNKMNLFLEGGMNFNYTGVMKSYIDFYGKEYSIINIYGNQTYVPNTDIQSNPTNQGGFGYGFLAGGGIGFTFTPQIGLELGGTMNYITVNLEGYREFRPSGVIYLRFILSNLINREEE